MVSSRSVNEPFLSLTGYQKYGKDLTYHPGSFSRKQPMTAFWMIRSSSNRLSDTAKLEKKNKLIDHQLQIFIQHIISAKLLYLGLYSVGEKYICTGTSYVQYMYVRSMLSLLAYGAHLLREKKPLILFYGHTTTSNICLRIF